MKWKGIFLRDKGIIIEKSLPILMPAKQVETNKIMGRNGSLTIDYGTYDDMLLKLECWIDRSKYDIDEVIHYLDGYGEIEYNGRIFKGRLKNAIEFNKVSHKFSTFPLVFTLNPISKAKDVIELNISNNSPFKIEKSTYKVEPIIEISGNNNIKVEVNDKAFYLIDLKANEKIILNCELKIITNEKGENLSSKMNGDFPYLLQGENNITWIGNINSFKVLFHETFVGG